MLASFKRPNNINMKNSVKYILIVSVSLLAGVFLSKTFLTASPSPDHINQSYTCSMHPDVNQQEAGLCPICHMDLVLKDPEKSSNTEIFSPEHSTLNGIQISLVAVQENLDSSIIALDGIVLEDPMKSHVQSSLLTGRIERLFIKDEGQQIKKGQLIAYVYSDRLETLFERYIVEEGDYRMYRHLRNSMPNLNLTDAEINRRLIMGRPYNAFPLLAERSGYVSGVSVKSGDYVNLGQPLFEIKNKNDLTVFLNADEYESRQLSVGMSVNLFNQITSDTVQGTISFIPPYLQTGSNNTLIKVQINNSHSFFSGELIRAYVHSGKTKGILIPKTAVLWTGDESVVYLKTEHGLTAVKVGLGEETENYYEIKHGLNVGDSIVYEGAFAIDAATQIQSYDRSMLGLTHTKNSTPLKKEDIKHYMALKDALVNDNLEEARACANAWVSTLDSNNTLLNSGKILPRLEKLATQETLEDQRVYFRLISKELIEIVSSAGGEVLLYEQYCPMANDWNGASWLSLDNEVYNPYFGDEMLHCGKVENTIAPK